MIKKIKSIYTKDNQKETGLNLSKSFFDISYKNHQVTSYPLSNDGVQLTKNGMLFDSSNGEYLEIPDNDDFDLGNNNFTIEYWFNKRSNDVLVVTAKRQQDLSVTNNSFISWINDSNTVRFMMYFTGAEGFQTLYSNNTINSNTWNHVSIVRNLNIVSLYLNGIFDNSTDIGTKTINKTPLNLLIGADNLNATTKTFHFDGYIQDFHIVKGIAIHTSSFTPNIRGKIQLHSNTVLALPLVGDISDKYNNLNLAQTITGYCEQFKGGKISVFDGTGDYYSVPNNSNFDFGSGDFTLDCIFKTSNLTPNQALIVKWNSSVPGNRGFYFGVMAGGYLGFYYTTDGITGIGVNSPVAIEIGKYYHFAAVRNGTEVKIYINGIQVGSALNIGTDTIYASTLELLIGANSNIAAFAIGDMKALRITKGQVLWTGNFVPPKELKKVSSNVVFLEDFNESNSGRFVYGENDYVSIGTNSDFAFGTNPFTLHFWAKTDTVSTFIYNKRSSLNVEMRIVINATGIMRFLVSTDGVSWMVNIPFIDITDSDGRFHHFAVVRNGDVFTVYIDGVYKNSQTVSINIPEFTSAIEIGRDTVATSSFGGNIKNFVIVNGEALWTTNFIPPVKISDYKINQNTKLFIPFENAVINDISPSNKTSTITNNGVVLESDFVDKSGNNHSIVNYGNVYTKYYHQGDICFDGSADFVEVLQETNNVADFVSLESDYIEVPHKVGLFERVNIDQIQVASSTDWNFDKTNMTIHFWVKHNGAPTDFEYYFDHYQDNTHRGYIYRQITTGRICFGTQDGVGIYPINMTAGSGVILDTNWHHVALVKNGTIYSLYVDGILSQSIVDSDTTTFTGDLWIGISKYPTFDYPLDGCMKNYTIAHEAIWTSTFTPTLRYLDYKIDNINYKLFIDFNDQVLDRSLSAHTTTNTGITFVNDVDNPIENGFYFNTNDFTIDFYVNLKDIGTTTTLLSCFRRNTDPERYWRLYRGTLNQLVFTWVNGATTYDVISFGTLSINTWYHISIVRNGSSFKWYFNGVFDSETITDIAITNPITRPLIIGARFDTDGATIESFTNMYIKNLRVFNGEALWSSAFTPPKTEIDYKKQFNDNCAFWLKGDSVIDSGRNKRHLNNVGISFASSSSNPYLQNTNIGNQDFTIECWLNCKTVASFQTVLSDWRTSTANYRSWILYKNTSAAFAFQARDNTDTSIISISGVTIPVVNTWYHIAIVRNGNNCYMFVNGIIEAIDTSASGFIGHSPVNILLGADWHSSGVSVIDVFDGSIVKPKITMYAKYKKNFIPELY